MKSKILLSIVSPVYRAEKIIPELVKRIDEEVSKFTNSYEIILVEDCGPDNSWAAIQQQALLHKHVKGIKLSRNFGQHYAVTAGLEVASGKYIVIMDCDLQDDPALISKIFDEINKGFEIVFTKRQQRGHSVLKSFGSFLFNKFFVLFSDTNYTIDMGSLVIFSEKVRNAFLQLKEKDRLYIQLLKWTGYKSTYMILPHSERFEGRSTYNFFSLVKLALQGWTSHSNKLLRLTIYIGATFSILSFFAIFWIVYLYFTKGSLSGWTSIVSLLLFSTGIILCSIGITGLYIGKIFEQVKDRPLYLVDEKLNFE
ncbi:MAG: hypothetical protein RIQ33_844 [Bacteroidota bacterium]